MNDARRLQKLCEKQAALTDTEPAKVVLAAGLSLHLRQRTPAPSTQPEDPRRKLDPEIGRQVARAGDTNRALPRIPIGAVLRLASYGELGVQTYPSSEGGGRRG
jgi:hypothetical protein